MRELNKKIFFRRQAGAYRPQKSVTVEEDKGYCFRDTDDRLSRLKTQPKEKQPKFNGVTRSATGMVFHCPSVY